MSLRVYTDGTETYAALDREHLRHMFRENVGALDWEPDSWEEVPGDKPLTIRDEDRINPETRTAAEWAASMYDGKGGLLCSTEF